MTSQRRYFDMVVAMDPNRGIGLNNQLPWHIRQDLQFFKSLTMTTTNHEAQNAIVMGKNTWLSLPKKPLPNRLNVVITSQLKDLSVPTNTSLDNALSQLSDMPTIEAIYLIGGAQLFQEGLRSLYCRYLFVTHIEQAVQADVFFPEFQDKARLLERSATYEEEGFSFYFAHYQMRSFQA